MDRSLLLYVHVGLPLYNQPKRPGDLDLSPFDLESGVRVTCDVGYLCANILVFLGLSVLDLGPMYATDRQTSDSIIA